VTAVRTPALRGRIPQGGGILLMPAAALAVHQLRYWLAYGSRANAELSAQGHSYLHSLVPWTVLALGVGATLFVRRLGRALATGETGRLTRLSVLALWALTWGGLVFIYASQETLESIFATGHPAGVAGIFGEGGWLAVPVAAAVAALVVSFLRVGRAVLRAASRVAPARWAPVLAVRVPAGVASVVVRPLARAAAGRAPPLALPSP
jgi:hypothetical protein